MSFATDDAVAQRVVSVIGKTFPTARSIEVTQETTSVDVPGWDSLAYTFLIMNVEAEFGIELPFEAASGLANVGDLVELVRSLSTES